MVEIIMGIIVAASGMCAFWGFVLFMSALMLEERTEAAVGAAMFLIPFIAGCIYVGVAA